MYLIISWCLWKLFKQTGVFTEYDDLGVLLCNYLFFSVHNFSLIWWFWKSFINKVWVEDIYWLKYVSSSSNNLLKIGPMNIISRKNLFFFSFFSPLSISGNPAGHVDLRLLQSSCSLQFWAKSTCQTKHDFWYINK